MNAQNTNVSSDFILGVKNSFKAFRFIFDHKLGHFFIYPLVITVALLLLTKLGIDTTVDWVTSFIYQITGIEALQSADWPHSWTDWGKFLGEKTIALLLWVLMFFVAHKIIKYVVLVLMSPVMAILSERTEKILTGKNYPFSFTQLLKDIWRGVIIATRNIFIEMGFLVVIWFGNFVLTSLFPPISIITSPLSLVFGIFLSAYFYGFATIDYVNERKKFSVSESYYFVRQYKGIAVGNGFVFWGLINIPFIGTYVGTVFAPILCAVGAVLALNEKNLIHPKNDSRVLFTPQEIKEMKIN